MGLYVYEKGCSSLLQYNKYYIDNIVNLYRNTIYITPSVESYLDISNMIKHKRNKVNTIPAHEDSPGNPIDEGAAWGN